jgi:hypothetical protein
VFLSESSYLIACFVRLIGDGFDLIIHINQYFALTAPYVFRDIHSHPVRNELQQALSGGIFRELVIEYYFPKRAATASGLEAGPGDISRPIWQQG